MPALAYLTSSDMVPGAPDARDDLFELEHQWAALAPACAARDLHLRLWVWDDPALAEAVDRGEIDAVVLGTPWDYAPRVEAFLATLDALAAAVPVLNPPPLVRWNARKTYLRDLEARGVASVPTAWVERVDEDSVAAAFAALSAAELVAKPVVGANAVRQVRLRRGAPLPPADQRPPGAALIQPFLPAVQDEGELSFVFCGGELSHALRKVPRRGDYRVQASYGGAEVAHAASPAEVEGARAVLAAAADAVGSTAPPLYARVDQVRGPGGRLLLMELEVIEPYLYPLQGPDLGPRFAAALEGALRREGGSGPGAGAPRPRRPRGRPARRWAPPWAPRRA
ncbi:hypothetical protein L6R53_22560 [Myxococcota bacterium]|nr:hypothetical protein [Myxococcota bacterium]